VAHTDVESFGIWKRNDRDDLCVGELRKRARESDRFELYKRPGVTTINPKRMRRKITNETWEQIKTAYAAGINRREIARKMNISEGTVTAHATRHRWSQQIQVAAREPTVMQSDAVAPMQPLQPVPQSDTIAPLKNTIAPAQNTQFVPLSVAAILAEP
jgi:IS30 family transposase